MGVMGGSVLSPDPRMNPNMNGGGGKQTKSVVRSSSHHGSGQKKKASPTPGTQLGGNMTNGGKDHFMMVAAEAMPLSSAGMYVIITECKREKCLH